ncbi:precorrin-2 C20-methyltransferase / cobalt-factor-2 C20-methyltransferase [Methanoculleus bourgensis MS2]|uniref:Precorrin-2 C20-methyltransferase / cobalt-factor-2 C20-methyltransferase n=1 Tax=Methanoculleus bourgensis (strain ATCC 43281 / DSM 3045 / OCM 15 / MS2) TaxID=1201294 RepID=I7J997_METBM|nr:cobalt-factor II C(20)-methyltransferase [Methanoculleus bourgensis]CCJ36508.1 precorrin-2 C20-methyltransferase / cobalt-factor-2 C20-methyltransferase [Methanoculleus bourgensis MS2]
MLVGVGLGPGDPELLTLRAVRLLKEAAAVFVPGNLAYDLVRPYRPDAVILEFPMTSDEDYIRECLEENADAIAPKAKDGLVVFGIIGDPNFYSTFSRLCEVIGKHYPEVAFATEPGISSITAFASVANVPVAGGFFVSDGSGLESRIFMKVRKPAALAASLKAEGYSEFVLVERMYMPEQQVYRGDDLPEESNYFSILFARRSGA